MIDKVLATVPNTLGETVGMALWYKGCYIYGQRIFLYSLSAAVEGIERRISRAEDIEAEENGK